MDARPECIVCVLRQALNTVRLVTDDEAIHHRVLAAVAARMSEATLDQTPARLSKPAYELVSAITGVADPYASRKRANNADALALLPTIRARVEAAEDPLGAAVRAAAAGNIIDLGIGHAFDIERDIEAIMSRPLAIDHTDQLREELGRGTRILYLGDNAGEIAFDRLLVERLLACGAEVTFAVKSGPVINDATLADAIEVGMTELVPVVETGSDDIGVNWDDVSGEFLSLYDSADIVISKGHGNFETTCDRVANSYFLLKAKCPVVAAEAGVQLAEVVFLRRRATGHSAD
ncbi:MAG TPA: ARMT1-like domain-containing protein [Thermoanaerobaculales bacterium]|nr:ARMT1-like domain-containing protein [Thermoanaerobaculales bacterium]HPA81937.1 ARMT1-like domain-containing protein [Thermoanaerobaculales bacterium]HQL29272.1 ARMT1-like domain-containing protein [Thermoanaerobaculales bacterium]HQN95899.1 ARMT1-like domain-containing protein [Thermoanaerobaculales bacterium]